MKLRYLFDALLAAGLVAALAGQEALGVALLILAVAGELTIAVIDNYGDRMIAVIERQRDAMRGQG
jgi:hypothetical protein